MSYSLGNKEFNVCGVLVRTLPEQAEIVADRLAGIPGVEVHDRMAGGRLVVTVEDVPGSWAAETMNDVNNVEGVIGASIVYHHRDGAEEQNQ